MMNETQSGVNVSPWKCANQENRVHANIQKKIREPKLTQPHQGNGMRDLGEVDIEGDVVPLNSKNSNPAINPSSTTLNKPKTGHEKGSWITVDVTGGNSSRGSRGLADRINPSKGSPNKQLGNMRYLVKVRILSRIVVGMKRDPGEVKDQARKKRGKTQAFGLKPFLKILRLFVFSLEQGGLCSASNFQ